MMGEEINVLNNQISFLEKETEDLEYTIEKMVEEEEANLDRDRKAHEEEMANYKKKNQRLKEELEKKLTNNE